jgi:hypothetical protein
VRLDIFTGALRVGISTRHRSLLLHESLDEESSFAKCLFNDIIELVKDSVIQQNENTFKL